MLWLELICLALFYIHLYLPKTTVKINLNYTVISKHVNSKLKINLTTLIYTTIVEQTRNRQ